MNEVLTYSGIKQARLIRQGEISSAELIEAHLARIAEVNPRLNAVVEVLAECAREGARAADERRERGALLGPFDGVPFSIKDSIDCHSVCAGSLTLQHGPPPLSSITTTADASSSTIR